MFLVSLCILYLPRLYSGNHTVEKPAPHDSGKGAQHPSFLFFSRVAPTIGLLVVAIVGVEALRASIRFDWEIYSYIYIYIHIDISQTQGV